jgi:hypothetical protein
MALGKGLLLVIDNQNKSFRSARVPALLRRGASDERWNVDRRRTRRSKAAGMSYR